MPEELAGRALPLEGGVNFRDFGGYPTTDGRRVKSNRLFRSGRLSELTAMDIEYLSDLNIKYCCDFRTHTERQKYPSRLPHNTQIVPLTIDAGKMESYVKRDWRQSISEQRVAELMRRINVELATNYVNEFRSMILHLLDVDEGAFLINCTAGKDRTGFGAALLLSALGVPREYVVADYLLSERYFIPEQQIAGVLAKFNDLQLPKMERKALLVALGVKAEYISGALDYIVEHHGTVERYLAERLSIAANKLTELRLEFIE